jgi:hypothetical protein
MFSILRPSPVRTAPLTFQGVGSSKPERNKEKPDLTSRSSKDTFTTNNEKTTRSLSPDSASKRNLDQWAAQQIWDQEASVLSRGYGGGIFLQHHLEFAVGRRRPKATDPGWDARCSKIKEIIKDTPIQTLLEMSSNSKCYFPESKEDPYLWCTKDSEKNKVTELINQEKQDRKS